MKYNFVKDVSGYFVKINYYHFRFLIENRVSCVVTQNIKFQDSEVFRITVFGPALLEWMSGEEN